MFKRGCFPVGALILSVLLGAALFGPIAPSAHAAGVFDPEVAALHQAVADAAIRKARAYVDALNQSGGARLEVTEAVFDARYCRIFFGVKGEIRVSQAVAALLGNRDRLFEGNGLVAYDLALTELKDHGREVGCRVDGEIILFQDQLLSQFAASTPGVNKAFSPAARTLLKFLEEVDIRPLAVATIRTLKEFSPENLRALRAEIEQRVATGERPLQRILHLLKGSGELAAFYVLTLVRGLPGTIAGTAGGTVGACVGTLLVPGIGTAVGGFVGGVIVGQMAQATIHRIPLDLEIAKLRRYGKLAALTPGTGPLDNRVEKARAALAGLIRKDLAANSYVLVDALLESLRKAQGADRATLLPAAEDLRQILQHRLTQEKDRYAGRKIRQLDEVGPAVTPAAPR